MLVSSLSLPLKYLNQRLDVPPFENSDWAKKRDYINISVGIVSSPSVVPNEVPDAVPEKGLTAIAFDRRYPYTIVHDYESERDGPIRSIKSLRMT